MTDKIYYTDFSKGRGIIGEHGDVFVLPLPFDLNGPRSPRFCGIMLRFDRPVLWYSADNVDPRRYPSAIAFMKRMTLGGPDDDLYEIASPGAPSPQPEGSKKWEMAVEHVALCKRMFPPERFPGPNGYYHDPF